MQIVFANRHLFLLLMSAFFHFCSLHMKIHSSIAAQQKNGTASAVPFSPTSLNS